MPSATSAKASPAACAETVPTECARRSEQVLLAEQTQPVEKVFMQIARPASEAASRSDIFVAHRHSAEEARIDQAVPSPAARCASISDRRGAAPRITPSSETRSRFCSMSENSLTPRCSASRSDRAARWRRRDRSSAPVPVTRLRHERGKRTLQASCLQRAVIAAEPISGWRPQRLPAA